jgi:hypothetical protein
MIGGLKVDTGYGKNAAAGLSLSSGINPSVSGFDDMRFHPCHHPFMTNGQ